MPLASLDPAQAMQTLQAGCRTLGLALTPLQIAQFETFYQALVEANAKFNLTAITEHEDVQIKHFLDSLVALPVIAEEVEEPLPLVTPFHLVDVGSGAGFPGIPLKLASPQLKLTLMDGTGKKISFLRELVTRLEVRGVEVVQGRAEELGRVPAHRGQYDLVTARAVAPLNTLVEYLLPMARRGGLVVVYKGAGAPQEFMEARKAVELLGGETVRLAPVQVPFLGEQRFILLIRKIGPTPDRYPRGQGLPRKKPLG